MPTNISWVRNPDGSKGESWNPVTGCTPVSEGCAHCYARTFAERFRGVKGHPYEQGFDVKLHPDRLEIPLKRKKPTTYFVPSMGDLWHEAVPDEFIDKVFAVMALAEQHTHLVLTKRPERARGYFAPGQYRDVRVGDVARAIKPDTTLNPVMMPWPLPNVWLGVSVENQARADERIPLLLDTPAAVRFVSAEPLLGPLELDEWLWPETDAEYVPHSFESDTERMADWRGPGAYCRHCGNREPNGLHRAEPGVISVLCPGLDWVIVGGESGGPPERRLVERNTDAAGVDANQAPRHLPVLWEPKPKALEWVRRIRNDCQAAGVPFFLKQLGPRAGQGTLLDGREWEEMPRQEVRA